MILGLMRAQLNLYKLFEPEKGGKILNPRFNKDNHFISLKPLLNRIDFFGANDGFVNKAEYKCLFDYFYESNQTSDNFIFDCPFVKAKAPIRIAMLKADGASGLKPPDIVI